jgi:hypothetical protein
MLTEERMKEISSLQERVALQGEDLYHKGTPWPDVVSRQHTAIYDLVNEVRRLQEFEPKKGRHSA